MRLRFLRLRLGLLSLLVAGGISTALVGSSSAADPPANCSTTGGVTTCVFGPTGAAQTWTVPAGVTEATFDVSGARGGQSVPAPASQPGGMGGTATATISVSAGSTYQLVVGGAGIRTSAGFNGGGVGGAPGGAAAGGGGGGASDVRSGSCAATLACGLADRILVAGGGGGGGTSAFAQAIGGNGDHPTGDSGSLSVDCDENCVGGGGSQSEGGAGGTSEDIRGATDGMDGALGQGGAGGNGGDANGGGLPGGGGGGGYYGGGGGGVTGAVGGGGGGGSSFGPAQATFGESQLVDGQITVSYATPAQTVSIAIVGGRSLQGRGVVSVAVHSTSEFDATTIDPASVCFGDAEAPAERDCTELNGKSIFRDHNHDGRLDALHQFETHEAGVDPGDTQACLTGETFEGTPIAGCASIVGRPGAL